jgi:DUF4097 and DUF4098 domain-containing protein YvlB
VVLVCGFAVPCVAQEAPQDRAEVPLTDPAKPAMVKVTVQHGSITVSGYSGKTVMVEAKADIKYESENMKEREREKEKEKPKKAEGMQLIQNQSTGLLIEEENNVVTVKVRSFTRKVDIDIKVPFKTSLKLKGFQAGEIKVDNVEGELEVTHLNGPITLERISGTVVANTLNGELKVSFERVNLDKPMSFSTLNGDIDVTFPKNAKFSLKMKSDQGKIYSDFELQMKPQSTPQAKPERKEGKYLIKFDKSMIGALNGGGEEVQFKTFNGDIYLRAKK